MLVRALSRSHAPGGDQKEERASITQKCMALLKQLSGNTRLGTLSICHATLPRSIVFLVFQAKIVIFEAHLFIGKGLFAKYIYHHTLNIYI